MEYGLVVVWGSTIILAGSLALPLVTRLFRPFPDQGASFAIPFSIALLGISGFLIGHIQYGWVPLLSWIGILLGLGWWIGDTDSIDYLGYVRSVFVFLGGFLFITAIRAIRPEIAPLPITAGEKFLDFGLLQTILRTEALPPQDMWFAGESLQYYYGGHLIASLLTTGTGTEPGIAYNLSLAVFFGALLVAGYGIAIAIADHNNVNTQVAGVLSVFAIGIAGNIHTFIMILAWILPIQGILLRAGVAPDHNLLTWEPADFFYWDASRIIDGTINEFPLFAWLNGDLHAHMMSTPFLLLVVGMCVAYWYTPEADITERRALIILMTPFLGLLVIINTWSFPVAGGLIALTISFASASPGSLFPSVLHPTTPTYSHYLEEVYRNGIALLIALVVLGVGLVWVTPFVLDSASTRGIGFFPERSTLSGLLIVHGGFLLVFVPYIAHQLSERVDSQHAVLFGGTIWLLWLVGFWILDFAAIGLFAPLLVLSWILLRTDATTGFETVLFVAGLGLILLVELLYVVDPGAPERLNTVFKIYMETWVLWAPAVGVVLAKALEWPDSRRTLGYVLVAIFLISTGSYAAFALPAHFAQDPVDSAGPTLDGTAYVETMYPAEAEAILWLAAQEGQPVLVTAAPGGYTWDPETGQGASAPASLTGLPTVLGWHHQEQYRGTVVYEKRMQAVTTIYEGKPSQQYALLETYDVSYIYIGPAEEARYDLTITDHPDISVAYADKNVTIYVFDGDT